MSATFVRRARPLLGTLVELGARAPGTLSPAEAARWAEPLFSAAWAAVAAVERACSAFDPGSDVARFNAAPAGAVLDLSPESAAALRLARSLWHATGGLVDVTLGSGPRDWTCAREGGATRLHKLTAAVRLDLGGVAKGQAVDRAFEALAAAQRRSAGEVACWVNAGGDLRVEGVALPVHLRDEDAGGARPWLVLEHGAVATSDFGPAARSRLSGAATRAARVSVTAPRCAWSDALTKVAALLGGPDEALFHRLGATAFVHGRGA
ncbi:MAG TPA: FAD:protein FMN transferase [Anaeromyxobacteraceae bacterium]|nr:FAD:protein FMN transferase [Anaeromyxobacteraceae bacterium]